jgi:8-oxo-dGTP diphosphatase
MAVTVTAFIFHEDKMLFIHHRKVGRWLHVGGHVEEGEYFDDALRREIREEVGLEVDIISPTKTLNTPMPGTAAQAIPFFSHGVDRGKYGRKMSLDYLCKVKGSPVVTLQQEEIIDYKWVTKDQLAELDTLPGVVELAMDAFAYYQNAGSRQTKI